MKNHWEHRDGDVVHGSYSLLQPDGHVRLVEYTADKETGFKAHVKYMYEGNSGGEGGDGGGSGGGGEFSPHNLDDVTEGQSSQISDGRSGHPTPKKSLKNYYKKPRTQKPGGPPGHYNKKSHYNNFEGHGKSAGGAGGFKKQRPHSAEHQPSNFEQLPKFSTVGGGNAGGGSPERYQSSPLLQDSPFGNDNGLSTDFFSRKYSTSSPAATPLGSASAEKSAYFSGIQHGHPSEQRRSEQPSSARPQRSYNGNYRAAGDDDVGRSQETQLSREGSDVTIHKLAPLREYHYEEPYPFEIPEGFRATDVLRAPHRKRHLWAAVPTPPSSELQSAQWYL